MLDFSLQEIAYGWLRVKIQYDRKYIIWSFDECLSDPLPGMVRMYNNLKERKEATWTCERGQTITFTTKFEPGVTDRVLLSVNVDGTGEFRVYDERKSNAFYNEFYEENNDGYPLGDREIIAEEEFATDVLIEKFETFFNLILSSKLYPCHYPCWSWQDDHSDAKERELEDLENGDMSKLDDIALEEFEREFYAKRCKLSEDGQRIYKEFDRMLRFHIVPDGWR